MTTEAVMTQPVAAVPGPGAGVAPRDDATLGFRPARGFAAQAVVDTFARPGARIGAVWIGLLVVAAVFAPFLANSQPLLVKMDGHWSSPLLRHLGPSDVTLLVVCAAAAALAAWRVPFPTSAVVVVWGVALLLPLTLWRSVRGGWLPGGDFSRTFGWTLVALLAVADVAVLAGVPLVSRAPNRLKAVVALAALPVIVLLLAFPVDPPQNVVWDEWRGLEAAGRLQAVYRTPNPFSPSDYQRDRPDARIQPPSARNWMGTENSGADVFSRMLHATRIALSIGFIATGISVVIGVTIGGLMGFFAGKVDIIGMRLIEIFEALPALILLLTFCAFFGRNLYLMMAIIGLLSWTGDARYIRGEFLRLRKQDFVQAAIAAGLPLRSVIFRHLLVNGITPVLVSSSFGVASAILLESTLSFLGLGLVDEPSWGQLLDQARAGGTGFHWWLATFPGLAIFLTVFSYNLLGEAVRDAIDPKLRKRE